MYDPTLPGRSFAFFHERGKSSAEGGSLVLSIVQYNHKNREIIYCSGFVGSNVVYAEPYYYSAIHQVEEGEI